MEIKSLPRIGTPPILNRAARRTLVNHPAQTVNGAAAALQRTERELVRHLKGSGALVIHDVAVPDTGTVIDHLCVSDDGVTAISVAEREGRAKIRGDRLFVGRDDRTDLVCEVGDQVAVLEGLLGEVGASPGAVVGAVCWAVDRHAPARGLELDAITIGSPRRVAKLVRRDGEHEILDVQLIAALARSRLGHEAQRSYRVTRT